ncbi:hypothetical protein FACS1894152_7780 [Bacilli bacterium]|nr:hypothetical protein FACS1894152_7780 [Bacilli bacterium]
MSENKRTRNSDYSNGFEECVYTYEGMLDRNYEPTGYGTMTKANVEKHEGCWFEGEKSGLPTNHPY